MARRKRATALFEVINHSRAARHPQKSKSSGWSGRMLFWRSPAMALDGAASQGAPESRSDVKSPAAVARPTAIETTTTAAPPIDALGEMPASVADETPAARSMAAPVPAAPDIDSAPRSFAFRVDQGLRQITMRMNYTTAIVGGFAILVAMGLAVIVGQHMNPRPTLLLSKHTSDQLRSGPVVDDSYDSAPVARISSPPASNGGHQPRIPSPAQPPAARLDARQAPPRVVSGPNRTIGLNYVVVQSYSDDKLAREAVDFLDKHGVSCTIEHHMKGWHAASIVVGTDGFSRLSSSEFKDYIARIEKLSDVFAPPRNGQRSYKSFQPTGYKWDR
jgi:hypothetical protein